MVTNKLFVLAVSLGSVTILLSILSLSLDYWQGNTLTGQELIEIFEKYQNVPTKPEEVSQNKSASFNSIKDHFVMEQSVDSPYFGSLINIHGGLWNFCGKMIEMPSIPAISIPEICIYLENDPNVYMPSIPVEWVEADWHAPRILLFLGLFCVIGSIVCVLTRWFVMLENRLLLQVGAGINFIAGIFFMGAFSVFADTMKLEFLYYQSAFYFCILSWLFSWATGGVILKSSRSKYDENIV